MKFSAFVFSLLFTVCVSQSTSAYQNKKVILLVNKASQPDSLGYNLVSSFLNFVYYLVVENKIKLWDSPYKSYVIDDDNLKGIESAQGLEFQQSDNFFIYEIWSSTAKASYFEVVGFAFSSTNLKNKEVSLGYIDYNDIEPYLKTGLVSININGYCNTTFYQVFMNKAYAYDLIYFDKSPVITKKGEKAEKQYLKGLAIKNKAFGVAGKNRNSMEVVPCKNITYEIRNFDYDSGSYLIFKVLNEYLEKSSDIFKYYAGEDISSMFKKSKPMITVCEVEEEVLFKNGKAQFNFIRLTPMVFGKKYYPVTAENIDTLNITVKEMTLKNYLLKHKFKLYITKINGFTVNPDQTEVYMRLLESGEFRGFRQERNK